MATITERVAALENLLKAAGMHQPTCSVIVNHSEESVCDCWIATE